MPRGWRQREHQNSNRLNKQNNNQSELGLDVKTSAPEDFACIWQSKRVGIIAIDISCWGAEVSPGKTPQTARSGEKWPFSQAIKQWVSNKLKPSEAWALLRNVLTNGPFKHYGTCISYLGSIRDKDADVFRIRYKTLWQGGSCASTVNIDCCTSYKK